VAVGRRALLTIWGPSAALMVLAALVGGRDPATAVLGLQYLCGLFLGLVPWKRSWVAVFAAAAFWLLALTSVGVWYAASTSWTGGTAHVSARHLRERFSGEEVSTWGSRLWEVSGADGRVTLEIEARRAGPSTGPSWFVSDPSIEVVDRTDEEGRLVSRIRFPEGHADPYLMRTFTLPSAAGGERFRVTAELRSDEPIAGDGCRGLWLSTWYEGEARACLPVAVGDDWSRHTLEWTVPASSRSRVVRVLLNDFDGLEFEVRDVRLEQNREGRWVPLGPLLPADAYVAFSGWGKQAEPQSGHALMVGEDWTVTAVPVELGVGAVGDSVLRVRIYAGTGREGDAVAPVLVRSARVVVEGEGAARSLPRFSWIEARQSWWFGHPNVAGHLLVMLMLLYVAVRGHRGFNAGLVTLIVGMAAIAATGSRISFLVGASAMALWLWRHVRQRTPKARLVAVVLVAGAAVLALAGGLGRGARLFVTDTTASRLDIWRVAVQSLVSDPLGLSDRPFAEAWGASYPQAEPVYHAHSALLSAGLGHGVIGLLAVAWLFGALLRAARRGGSEPLALAALAVAPQLVDDTVHVSWVFVAFAVLVSVLTVRTAGAGANAVALPD